MFFCEFCKISFFTEHLWATASASNYSSKEYVCIQCSILILILRLAFLALFLNQRVSTLSQIYCLFKLSFCYVEDVYFSLFVFHIVVACFPQTSGNIWQKQPPEVFYKKSVLKNFAKFIGKQLCQSLFFNKGLQLHLKTGSGTGVYQRILWNIWKYHIYKTSGRLLLIWETMIHFHSQLAIWNKATGKVNGKFQFSASQILGLTKGFLTFSGGIETWYWTKMG